MSTIYRVHW